MAADMQLPTHPWLSAYQPILFGITDPSQMYQWQYTGVTDVDGKAQFTYSGFNPYGTPPCGLMYITSGTYEGIHVIRRIQDDGSILTDTDYDGNASGTNGRLLFNFKYRIWYGYPTQDDYVDVKPVWDASTGQLIQDLSKYLESIFRIKPPVAGMDVEMFKHFRVQIVPAQDLQDYFDALVVDIQAIIETGVWDYDDDTDVGNRHIWYLCNGTLPHAELNAEHLGNEDVLSPDEPITFPNECIVFSKVIYDEDVILNNIIYNVIYCTGTAAETGIGFMEIEDDFIVS